MTHPPSTNDSPPPILRRLPLRLAPSLVRIAAAVAVFLALDYWPAVQAWLPRAQFPAQQSWTLLGVGVLLWLSVRLVAAGMIVGVVSPIPSAIARALVTGVTLWLILMTPSLLGAARDAGPDALLLTFAVWLLALPPVAALTTAAAVAASCISGLARR